MIVGGESCVFAKKFLAEFSVDVVRWNKHDSWADVPNSMVALQTHVSCIAEFYSLMCHELQHVLAYRSGKWIKYHTDTADNRYMHRNGLRIERWIDSKAEEMFNVLFPDLKFVRSYRDGEDVEYYRKWLNKNYPLK